MKIVVCQTYVAGRVDVDPITAEIDADPRSFGAPLGDKAALELALSFDSAEVVVACVGPVGAEQMLRDALAVGATRVVRIDAVDASALTARDAASALLAVCADADLVFCGDGGPNGSGAVPALIASMLGRPQLLDASLVAVENQTVTAHRRVDRGRIAVYSAPLPAVVSVLGSVATLRRASLPGVMAAETATIERMPMASTSAPGLRVSPARPLRQRTKLLPAPAGETPRERVLSITKATEASDPPRTLRLDPAEAAAEAVETLRQWGYL